VNSETLKCEKMLQTLERMGGLTMQRASCHYFFNIGFQKDPFVCEIRNGELKKCVKITYPIGVQWGI
jgi:hypothetical protein